MNNNYDVIVLGVGSMGSATCHYLAKRGHRVLGLEQFEIPHDQGSHAGQSRIIRKAYFEHPNYVPLLQRAYENWKSLESDTGTQVYFPTGLLYAGKPDGVLIRGVKESAEKYSVSIEPLNTSESKIRLPQFNIPDSYDILFEPDAGFVTPERAVLLFVEQAIKHGAEIRTKEKVIEWKESGAGISVKTDKGTYNCAKLIITAGPWASQFIPQLSTKLSVTRQVIAWVNPKQYIPFELGKFPCWLIDDDSKPGMYYGFPVLPVGQMGGPIGLKVAHHYPGTVTDPNNVNRISSADDETNLIYALNKFLPEGYKSMHVLKTCLYTNTSDENFVIDFLPGYDNVVIAAGFSGHGFKFASVIGEIMTDLAMNGNTRMPIEFLNINRFNDFKN
jgi:sarcosine oxidase